MKKKPNILLFFPDQYHPDWDGFHPHIPVKTPNLQGLAKEGVRFTNAVCPSPLCAPSRASLASGMEYSRCRVPSNQENYPLDQQTFYSLLRDDGYEVLGCGKFDLHKPNFSWGTDGKNLLDQWGFTDGIDNEGKIDGMNAAIQNTPGPYLTYLKEKGLDKTHIDDFLKRKGGNQKAVFPTPLDDEAYCDNWIGRNGIELLESVPEDKPWFLQVNFDGPHAPMDITEDMKQWYGSTEFLIPSENSEMSRDDHMEVLRNYAAMIENIDMWLGTYISWLKEKGQLDNTLIVFSADHGEMLGAKNRWGKCRPERASAGIPLFMSGPGVELKNSENTSPQTSVDLAATFLDLAGISIPGEMDSRSLLPLLKGKVEKHRNFVISELNQTNKNGRKTEWKLVFDGRYKLVLHEKETLELWDLQNDPEELIDISESQPEKTAELVKILENI